MDHDGVFSHTLRWRLFSVDEFHYLNVIQVGTFTAFNDFDCAFECLRNALCVSINLAAYKGPGRKLWGCELLSCDKYRNAKDFKVSKSSHHLSIMVGSAIRLLLS